MIVVQGGKKQRETIQLTKDTTFRSVAFYACTFVAYRQRPHLSFEGCHYVNCTFVYDGMEVDFQEWITLITDLPEQSHDARH